MDFACNVCGCFNSEDFRHYCGHLLLHSDSEFESRNIVCQINQCPASFRKYETYRRHCRRRHPDVTHNEATAVFSNTMSALVMHDSYETAPSGVTLDAAGPETSLAPERAQASDRNITQSDPGGDRLATRFVLMMKEKHRLTQIGTVDMVREVHRLLTDVWHRIDQNLSNSTDSQIAQAAAKPVSDAVSPLLTLLESLRTPYLQRKHFIEKCGMVLPREMILGHQTVIAGPSHSRRVSEIPSVMYYVSLRDTLQMLVRETTFINLLENCKPPRNDLVTSFVDGDVCNQHPLFSTNPNAIQVMLYYDEVELCNPLGSKTHGHKLAIFYVTFCNIPPMFRSQLKYIFLLSITVTPTLLQYGVDTVIKPFLKEIRELSSSGITVTDARGENITVMGDLALITADTLAAHQLLGLKEGVGFARRKCRHCMANFTDMQKLFLESEFRLRTVDKHIYHCENLRDKSAEYGVNRRAAIFTLPNFNPFAGTPQDIMHVILEGCVAYTLRHILRYYIVDSKDFTLADLNERIENFPYTYQDYPNRPSTIKHNHLDGTLRQSSSQFWLLGRMLPFLIGEMIDFDTDHWKCYVTLLEILSIVAAHSIPRDQIAYLRQLIGFHLSLFRKVFPASSIIPKQHYLLHIPKDILNLGPPVHYWCMRFEAKHSFFKNLAGIASFKNVAKYMSERHQENLCMVLNTQFVDGRFFESKLDCGPSVHVDQSERLPLYRALLQEAFADWAKIMVCNWVNIDGQVYKRGSFVLYNFLEDLPVFGKLIEVLLIDGGYRFVLQAYITEGCSESLNALKVSQTNTCLLYKIQHGKYHEPTSCYEFKNAFYIPVKSDYTGINMQWEDAQS